MSADPEDFSSENLAHVIAMEVYRTDGKTTHEHEFEQVYICKHCGVAEERV
jgi:hypothetical protein